MAHNRHHIVVRRMVWRFEKKKKTIRTRVQRENFLKSIFVFSFLYEKLGPELTETLFLYLQIPNPLFDLAGLTCGHYLIPFWTFFGATVIGKAVVKMHIQQLAVIIAFNEELLDKVIGLLALVPYVGRRLQEPLKKYLIEQKNKLHEKSSVVRIIKKNIMLCRAE